MAKAILYEPDPCVNDQKPKPKKQREPNLCKKERKVENPYEVWKNAMSLVQYMPKKLKIWQ